MHARLVLIVVSFVALVAGGCTGPAPEADADCPAPGCADGPTDGSPRVLPPRGSDLTLPEALYPTFQMRGCEAFGIGVELEASEVASLLPDAFVPAGVVEGRTGNVVVEIIDCAGAVDNSSVFGALATLQVRVRVDPVDPSWRDGSTPAFFLLEAVADNQGWARALSGVELTHGPASFTFERTGTPDGSFVARIGVEATDWAATLTYPKVAWDNENQLGYTMFMWYGSGPYHRFTHQEQSNSSGLPSESVFTVTGASRLAEAMPAPATAYFLGTHYTDKHVLLQYDGAWN